jgi:hypothetical protein
LLVRTAIHKPARSIGFRDLWGKEKRADLLATADQERGKLYKDIEPVLEVGLPFQPGKHVAGYFAWPLFPELFPHSFPGVKTSRDDALVDFSCAQLRRRMEQYFDTNTDEDEIARIAPSLMASTARFDPLAVRAALQKRGMLSNNLVRYCYRPFDNRWVYWEPETKLLDEKRPGYFLHVFMGNSFLFTTGRTRKAVIEPALATHLLTDLNCMDSGARGFPLYILPDRSSLLEQADHGNPKPNLTEEAAQYLRQLGADEKDLFFHCLCVLHSTAYRRENTATIRHDWPRMPLPDSKKGLLASAELGRQVAGLLDTESPVKGVTAGTIRPELKAIGAVTRFGGGNLDPDTGDLDVTASWGHAGKGGVTMPAKGRAVERDYSREELSAFSGRPFTLDCLGKTTFDVYLNDRAYWKNVPARVWEYTIGGYQVIKKWLSYREKELLGRSLTMDEARYVTEMARRIAVVLLLEPALDANYETVKANTYSWPKAKSAE